MNIRDMDQVKKAYLIWLCLPDGMTLGEKKEEVDARMRGKKTPRQFAEEITTEMLEALAGKFQRWKAGDESAALTEEEVDFIQRQQKITAERDVADSTCDYLSNLTDDDLEEFRQDLKDSLN